MYDETYLAHYGRSVIDGAPRGSGRYPRGSGENPKHPAGAGTLHRKVSEKTRAILANRKKRLADKVAKKEAAKKQAEEEAKAKHAEELQKLVNSGTPQDVWDVKDELTENQMKAAIARFETEDRLAKFLKNTDSSSLKKNDVSQNQSKLAKAKKFLDTYTGYAKTVNATYKQTAELSKNISETRAAVMNAVKKLREEKYGTPLNKSRAKSKK